MASVRHRLRLSARHAVRPILPAINSAGSARHRSRKPPNHVSSRLSYTPQHLAEKILTSRSALEGERKQVTVLFADMKGLMELLADRDPEEARKFLDPVLERMIDEGKFRRLLTNRSRETRVDRDQFT